MKDKPNPDEVLEYLDKLRDNNRKCLGNPTWEDEEDNLGELLWHQEAESGSQS